MENIIEINRLTKNFGKHRGIENISFGVKRGEAFGFLGPNGAGKTTTIRMLLGIIKKDSGEITWKGKAVDRKNVNFGYLPEERGIYPKTRIVDQLEYFAKLKGMSNQVFKQSLCLRN